LSALRLVDLAAVGSYARVVIFPFIIFWVFVFLARKELGWRWTLIVVGIWCGLLAAFMYSGLSPYLFVAAQAVLDAILIIAFFKGDIRIR